MTARMFIVACAAVCLGALPAMAEVSCDPIDATAKSNFEYFVSVANHDQHLLHVSIRYHEKQPAVFQMPVWNALYQVRDFAQYVTAPQARNTRGEILKVLALDKTSWQVAASDGCAVFEYDVFANSPGPFSAQANMHHVFINWAQVLMFAPASRKLPLSLTVTGMPKEWSLHDLGLFDENAQDGGYHLTHSVDYDTLVDSPVDIAPSQISTFAEDGAQYRIVVDGDQNVYDLPALVDATRKVVHAEVDWMQDRPFTTYTFLYHFLPGPNGGGMEHRFGTAIAAPASRVHDDPLAPIGTAAHEFFHLWNVKRIRPQSMEPVDFEHEQYSRSLWFCEGVTSAVSELMMVRAGLQDEGAYLAHLSGTISDLEARPARGNQSPEASSVEAWLEGRPYYRRPERSVSYYTTGEVLGTLLDLRIRQLTHGAKSLRDLFQFMNKQYAKQGRFYDDATGVQHAAEYITGASLSDFFDRYVRGTSAIPYDEFFQAVGLKLQTFTLLAADAGFDANENFTGSPEVIRVAPGSAVEAAGVRIGDTLISADDHEMLGDLGSYLVGRKPGETVAFRFTSHGKSIDVTVQLTPVNQPTLALVDLPVVTPAQRSQRAAWIVGNDLPQGGAR